MAPVRAVILRNSACIRGSTNAVIFRLTGFAVGIGYKDTPKCANAQVGVSALRRLRLFNGRNPAKLPSAERPVRSFSDVLKAPAPRRGEFDTEYPLPELSRLANVARFWFDAHCAAGSKLLTRFNCWKWIQFRMHGRMLS